MGNTSGSPPNIMAGDTLKLIPALICPLYLRLIAPSSGSYVLKKDWVVSGLSDFPTRLGKEGVYYDLTDNALYSVLSITLSELELALHQLHWAGLEKPNENQRHP